MMITFLNYLQFYLSFKVIALIQAEQTNKPRMLAVLAGELFNLIKIVSQLVAYL